MVPIYSAPGKAGDGNRTHMTSLEGWGFTIKLRPQVILKHYFRVSSELTKFKIGIFGGKNGEGGIRTPGTRITRTTV